MGTLIQAIIGFFSAGAGQKIGAGVANLTALAALAPVAYWFLQEKDTVAVSLTWGELALFGAFAFALVKVAHYTRPGAGSPG